MPGATGSRSLLVPIAAFELRLRLRSGVFWIVVAISVLMVFGSVTVERLRIGPLPHGARNSAEAVAYIHLVWSLFFLFTAAAFSQEALGRDEQTGFGPLLRSTPVRERDHVLGRFAGSFGAVALSFLSVPLGLALGTLAPWVPPDQLGPFRPGPTLEALLVLALPNLFVACAVLCTLAAVTRSAVGAYLGAVALLILYGLGSGTPGGGTLGDALLDPFGFAAYGQAANGWAASERAARLPAPAGALLWNRLLWIAVGIGCLALAVRRFSFAPRTAALREEQQAERVARTAVQPVREGVFDGRTRLAQLTVRTRFELRQVFRSPFFAVLMLLGIANGVATLWPVAASAPPTLALIERLDEAFRLVPIVVALFYAGELVWSERDGGVHELIGAAPVPDWIILAPKTLALTLVLAATIGAGALAGMAVQVWQAGTVDLPGWLAAFALPRSYDAALIGALAIFFQAAAPGKLAGFGLMVLWLIASLAMESAGLHGELYRYGGHGSTLAPAETATGPALLVRAYWGAFAAMLLVVAHQLVGRGGGDAFAWRLRRLPGRLTGRAGLAAGVAGGAWAGLALLLLRGG